MQDQLPVFQGNVNTHVEFQEKNDRKTSVKSAINYRTRAIITRGLYTFYQLFEVQKRFFKGLFS